MLRKLISLLAFLLFFLLTPANVSAAQLEVPSQYSSIQSAINAAQNGDMINIGAGTYNEVISFNGKAVIVRGAGPGLTILDGTGFEASVVSVVSGETTDTVLEGVTVTNGTGRDSILF